MRRYFGGTDTSCFSGNCLVKGHVMSCWSRCLKWCMVFRKDSTKDLVFWLLCLFKKNSKPPRSLFLYKSTRVFLFKLGLTTDPDTVELEAEAWRPVSSKYLQGKQTSKGFLAWHTSELGAIMAFCYPLK